MANGKKPANEQKPPDYSLPGSAQGDEGGFGVIGDAAGAVGGFFNQSDLSIMLMALSNQYLVQLLIINLIGLLILGV